MIETIYSNESGDANRTNRVQNTFKMPKNVRQVGKSNATKKIYVEDYVMTFIKQLTGGDFSGCKLAVLVGQCIKLDNCRNIFISGAVEVKEIDTTYEISFSNDIWAVIYEDIKKYFVDTEIVGWFIGGPGYMLEEEDKILKAHVDNFAGQDKTLLTYDNMEREETFLSYENNKLCKLDGYYIYYEKNEEMQTYMIEQKKSLSNEATYDDRVSRDIRTVLQNKKPQEEESRSISRLMYAAGTLLAVIILVVGAAMLSNYDQMKSMQSALNDLTRNMEEVQTIFAENEYSQTDQDLSDANIITDEADTDEESLDVKVVPGEVEPMEETDSDNEDGEEDETPATDEELASEDADNEETDNVEETDNDEEAAVDTEEDAAVIQEQTKYYTVETGDTLADISFKLYNTYTKVGAIMELNNIENKDYIFVGQKLIVP